jgi:hypothetical protein
MASGPAIDALQHFVQAIEEVLVEIDIGKR